MYIFRVCAKYSYEAVWTKMNHVRQYLIYIMSFVSPTLRLYSRIYSYILVYCVEVNRLVSISAPHRLLSELKLHLTWLPYIGFLLSLTSIHISYSNLRCYSMFQKHHAVSACSTSKNCFGLHKCRVQRIVNWLFVLCYSGYALLKLTESLECIILTRPKDICCYPVFKFSLFCWLIYSRHNCAGFKPRNQ